MNMKKAMAMLLALVLVFACTTVAGAINEPNTDGGVITVDPWCETKGICRHYFEESECKTPTTTETPYFQEHFIDELGHDWKQTGVIDSTCTAEGETQFTCDRCGATKVEPIEMKKHEFKYLPGEDPLGPLCAGSYELYETCVNCGLLTGNTEWTKIVPHVWDEENPVLDWEATCVKEGQFHWICKNCGAADEPQTIAIDPDNHDYGEWNWDVKPTCTEPGLHYQLCNWCLTARHDEEVPANGHSWDEGVVTKAPTCIDMGEMTYTCTVCGETKVEPIDMIEHDADKAHPVFVELPTCTTEGVANYPCVNYENCGVIVYENVAIPSFGGHLNSVVDVVKEPTCYSVGYQRHWCMRDIPGLDNTSSKCQTVVTEEFVAPENLEEYNGEMLEIIPMTPHHWGEWVERNPFEPGVTQGYWIRECEVCHETEYKIGEGTGDTIVEENRVDATCTEDGHYDVVVYDYNGQEMSRVTETIPALGHDFSVELTDAAVVPTCETAGKTVMQCSRCDATEETEVPATGHDFSLEEIVEPTCDTEGSKVIKCFNCGAAEGEPEVIPALGHDFSVDMPDEAVAPTCTTVGKTVKKCSRCDAREETEVAMVEHTLENVPATEPTASKAGNKEYQICTVCNKAFDTTGAEINPADMVIAPEGGLSDEDGTFKYYDQAGEVMTSYSGLVDFEGGKFFVRNGILDTNVNGVQSPDAKTFYFFANGQICDGANGFAEYDGQWFVIKEGVLQTGFNGLFEYMGAKFWVAAGQKTNYTGLMKTEEGWLYLVEGQFYPITDLVSYDGAIFYVKDGKLQESFTGTVKDFNGTEFNVVNGMVK